MALSMAKIENEIKAKVTPEEVLESFSNLTIKNFEEINGDNVLLIFQPIYHPVVARVKDSDAKIKKDLHSFVSYLTYSINNLFAIKDKFCIFAKIIYLYGTNKKI